MKLNPDCIRDILLTVEENTSYGVSMRYEPSKLKLERLEKYSNEELFYHTKQCKDAYLISGVSFCSPATIYIDDLTPNGHRFLADVRGDTVWNKTKSIANKVGSHSLDTLSKIAVNIISEMIKNNF